MTQSEHHWLDDGRHGPTPEEAAAAIASCPDDVDALERPITEEHPDDIAQCWRNEPHAPHTWTLSPEEGGVDCPGIDPPTPAPTALRDRYAAALHGVARRLNGSDDFGYAPGNETIWQEQADAVLAVRDREREQARAELVEERRQLEARVRHVADQIAAGAPWTANHEDTAARIRAAVQAEEPSPTPAAKPQHIGNWVNAEDCPGCSGTNPPYPFICPGEPS